MEYKIPFNYVVDASITIKAPDLATAIAKVEQLAGIEADGSCRLIHGFGAILRSDIDLGSIQINKELAEDWNPKKSYTVKLVRTQTVEVEVEAHSLEEAERVAIEGAEDGSLDDFSNCIDEEIVAEEVELVD